LRRHLSDSLIKHQFFYFIISLPEIEQLVKYFSEIIGVFIDAISLAGFYVFAGNLHASSFLHCCCHCIAPMLQLFR
jgi:hypothetical protein